MGVIMTDDEVESLTTAWRTRWGENPVAYELRDRHADRWVRFHSLPQSKRYAETEDEYEIILDRHHQVLIFACDQERDAVRSVSRSSHSWVSEEHAARACSAAPAVQGALPSVESRFGKGASEGDTWRLWS